MKKKSSLKKPDSSFKVAEWTKKWAKTTQQGFMFYPQTDSTNERAKAFRQNISSAPLPSLQQNTHLREGDKTPHFKTMLFIAQSQTAGRGRGSKKWINSDMMLSWSYILSTPPQPSITYIMGCTLHKALRVGWPEVAFRIKKPNDIYIGKKKMAGILTEAVSQGPSWHHLIIGVGMNVFSHPLSSNEAFTHLQEHTQNITEEKWTSFIELWYKSIAKVLV